MSDSAIKARVYLGNSPHIVKSVHLIGDDGTEGEPLVRYVHLGTITDSVMFGEDLIIRFFTYHRAIQFYRTVHGEYEIINESDHTITFMRDGCTDIKPGERIVIRI